MIHNSQLMYETLFILSILHFGFMVCLSCIFVIPSISSLDSSASPNSCCQPFVVFTIFPMFTSELTCSQLVVHFPELVIYKIMLLALFMYFNELCFVEKSATLAVWLDFPKLSVRGSSLFRYCICVVLTLLSKEHAPCFDCSSLINTLQTILAQDVSLHSESYPGPKFICI